MKPIISYNFIEFEDAIDGSWRRMSRDPSAVMMVGLLFARENSKLVSTDMIPSKQYFHLRSGDNVDFFWIGWGTYFDDTPGPIMQRDGWYFDNDGFIKSVKKIEERTTWKYSGATDLLLANVRRTNDSERAQIDFSSMIVCQLESMLEQKAISRVDVFFESIFRFAEDHAGNNPTWGFSDSKLISVSGSVLKKVVLSLLPKNIGADLPKIEHFAVRDVSKI